jgi:hypothetical protein
MREQELRQQPHSRSRRRPSTFARLRFRGALPRLPGRLSAGCDLEPSATASWSAASFARPTLNRSRPEPSATADRLTSSPTTRNRGALEYRIISVGSLSRRDLRTQPGVLTPGNDRIDAHPEGVEDWTLGWAPRNSPPYVAGPLGPLRPLHLAARPKSRTACPTKPKLYVADRLGRPGKRGALHKMDVGEVGCTRTKRDPYPHVVRP